MTRRNTRWRRSAGPWLGRSRRKKVAAIALAALLAFLAVGLFPEGPVHGAPAGVPSLSGYFIVGNGSALAVVGYVGWLGTWTAAGNGSQVYAADFYLVFFNLHPYNVTVDLLVTQGANHVEHDSVVVPSLSSVDDQVGLPQNTAWTSTGIAFDGKQYWTGWVATPISLLPSYILNVGGLDLFVLTIVYVGMMLTALGVWLGKRVMNRAGWAPHFSVLAFGHVVIGVMAGAVVVDYQLIDQLFAGWAPFIYPIAALPFAFLGSLSYFNRASSVELLAGTETTAGELGFYRTQMRIARVAGRLAFILGGWGDMWARYFGHQAYAEPDDPHHAKPWLAPVIPMASPTDTLRERLRAKRRAHITPLTAQDALTRFPVVNAEARDDVQFIAFVKSDRIPQIRGAWLSIHKWVHEDEEKAPDPSGGPPIVVKKARDRRKLAWPHYVEPPKGSVPDLEDIHFMPAGAVFAHFATVRDLGRLNSKYAHQAALEAANRENRIQDEVYADLKAKYSLIRRASSGITDEEAAEQTGKVGAYVGTEEPTP
jgi:hypothetical protein